MSNNNVPGSNQNVNVQVRTLTIDPNVTSKYKTKILHKNVVNGVNTLTQSMMNDTNTKYVIKYDYVLGENITILANCVLEFDGGSISGEHTLTGNNTGINAGLVKIFNTDITLAGTWNASEIYPEWFGATSEEIDNSSFINKSITFARSCGIKTVVFSTMYTTTNTVYLKRNVYIKGKGGVEAALYSNEDKSSCGIRLNDTTCSKWAIDTYDINGNTVSYNTPFHEASFVTSQTPDINADILIRDIEITGTPNNESVIKFGAVRIGGCTPLILDNVRIQGKFKYGLNLCQCYGISIKDSYFDVVNIPLVMNGCTTSTIINTWFCKYATGDDLDSSMFSSGALPPYLNNPKHVAIMLINSRIQAINSTFERNDAIIYGIGYYAILDSAYYELGNSCQTVAFGTDAYLYQKGNIAPEIFLPKTYSHGIVITKQFMSQEIFRIGFDLEDISVGYVYIDDNSKNGNVSPIRVKCNPSEKNRNLAISYYDNVEYVDGVPVFSIKGKNKFEHLNDVYISTFENDEDFHDLAGYWYTRSNRLGTLFFPTTYKEMCTRSSINNCMIHWLYNYLNSDGFGGTDIISNKTLNITADERANISGNVNIYPVDTVVLKDSCINFYCDYNPYYLKNQSKPTFKVSGNCSIEFKETFGYSLVYNYKFLELYGNEPINVKIVVQNQIYDDGTIQDVISNPDFTTPYIVEEYSKNGELYKIYTNPTRPTTNVPVGYMYIENGKPIWYQGNNVWKDAIGTPV